MTLADAIVLVRQKHLDERDGVTSGRTAESYRHAVAECPATMALAHCLLALEMHAAEP